MLINLTVGSKFLDGEDGFKDSSWEVKLSRTRRLLAYIYALQLNRPAEFACGDAGEPWWTYTGTKLETAGAQGKTLTKSVPALCAEITSAGVCARLFQKEEQRKRHARNLKTPASIGNDNRARVPVFRR
jgi:hypothetical protein